MGKHTLTLTQKVITFTQIISAVCVVIVTVTLAGVSYQKTDLDEDQHRVDELLTNWGQAPILAITSTTSASCPDGYSAAFERTWPGFDADCWCGGSTDATRSANGVTCTEFCSGTCSDAQKSAGCTDVSARDKVSFSKIGMNYGATTPGYAQLCLKRSTTESWRNNGVASRGTCPDGYTTCGSTAENRYCTKESTCPFVGFSLNTAQLAAQSCIGLGNVQGLACAVVEYNPTIPSFKTVLALTAAQQVALGSTPGLPISQFSLNEYGMCYTKTKDNITPDREEYFQLSSKRTTCNQEANSLWKSLITINEATLFAANGISVTGLNSESGMNGYYQTGKSGSDYSYSIYQQPYVSWSADHQHDLETFFKNTDLIPRIKMSQKGYLAMTVIGGGFLIFVVFIELLKLCGKVNPNGWFNKMKRGIRFLALFAQIPLILWSLLLVAVGRHYFIKISEAEVAENAYVDGNFALFAEHLTQARASTATCFAVVVGCLILDLVLYCLWKRADKKAKQAGGVQRIESEQNNINVK